MEQLSAKVSSLQMSGIDSTKLERTFIMVKPDGVQRGIVS
jgi:hypothetical protein